MSTILLVEARFYPHLNDMLLEGARKTIEAAGHKHETLAVPGALDGFSSLGRRLPQGFDGSSRSRSEAHEGHRRFCPTRDPSPSTIGRTVDVPFRGFERGLPQAFPDVR